MNELPVSELRRLLEERQEELRSANRKLHNAQVRLEAERIMTRELRKQLEEPRARLLELIREKGILESRLERLPMVEQELDETRQQLLEVLERREADIKAAVREATGEFERQRGVWSQEQAQLIERLNALQAEADGLRDQISKHAAEATTATPQDLAGHFARVVEDLQAEAMARTDRKIVSTMRSFEVELKGIVQADEETKTTRLILPAAGEVDPNQLSTLRMSFAAIPTLWREPRATEEEPPS
jgi:chromosome segregation ATPase